MKCKWILFFTLFILLILLTACSNSDKTTSEKPKSNETTTQEQTQKEKNPDTTDEPKTKDQEFDLSFLDELDEIPQTTADIINQKAGLYAGVDVTDASVKEQVLKDINRLAPLPEDASEEQLNAYFKYLYSLVAEDYPDPKDTIKKWEFGSFGDPDLPDSRFHFKEKYNVEVLLDGSGSMGAYIGNKTMMQIAKEAINNFMKQVPEEANVSLRVYGHKGTGSNSDKKLSCSTIEQIYGYAPYEEKAFQKELDKIQPAGWTPLADALKKAEESLSKFDTENNTNLIYVVSDGVETCDGDPVAVAKSLADSNAKPIINIIGFNVNSEAQAQLKEMAKVSGGIFSTANDQSELEAEFKRAQTVLEAWEEWKYDAEKDLEFMKVENKFDILGVWNEWNSKILNQYLNMGYIIDMAWEEGIITKQHMESLHESKRQIEALQKQTRNEIEEELNNLSEKKIEEIKAEINRKYNEQTQN
jgi:Ca-activated chloride channel homolog